MDLLAALIILASGILTGIILLLFYILGRMMRNDGWDDSNITNALRLLSHVTLHGEDFGKMVYLTPAQAKALVDAGFEAPKRPFWYVKYDEFQSVVKTRPG